MDRIPKIVFGRLKAQPAPGPHPDPELLAAFAENALPEAGRDRLLQHLGACSDCREILYLALPDSPETQKVLVLQPRPFGFRRWVLGWSALVASLAVTAIFFATNQVGHRNQSPPSVASAPAGPNETETKIAAYKSPQEIDQLKAGSDAFKPKTPVALEKTEPRPQPEAKHMTGRMQTELVFEESGQVRVQAPAKSAGTEAALAGNDEKNVKEKDERQKPAVLNGVASPTGSAGKLGDFAYAKTVPAKTRADQQGVADQVTAGQTDAISESKSEPAPIHGAPAVPPEAAEGTNALDLPASRGLTGASQPTGGTAQDRNAVGSVSSGLKLAHGSTLHGSLGGIIVDPSGAVVGKAKITMVGPGGSETASSDLAGRFSFNLPPGSYSIKAEASGFKATEIRQVAVLDNQISSIQLELEPGAASETVEVSAAAPIVAQATAAPTPVTNSTSGLVATPQQTAQLSQQEVSVARTNRREVGGGAGSGARASTLRWTLSHEGTVQRSADSGKTWQAISVATGVSFRALSALGASVWVGGNSGALYHSADSGMTWARVEPTAGGKKLDQDIVHLEFSDLLRCALNTANGEVWTTSDGGKTWQRK